MADHPHCDQNILHSPKSCDFCDQFSARQEQRISDGVNFTGDKDPNKAPCPSEALRPTYVAHRWVGNQPTNIPFQTEAESFSERLEEMKKLP